MTLMTLSGPAGRRLSVRCFGGAHCRSERSAACLRPFAETKEKAPRIGEGPEYACLTGAGHIRDTLGGTACLLRGSKLRSRRH